MSPKTEKSGLSDRRATSTSNSLQRVTRSEKETIELGKAIGGVLPPGITIALVGPLGSGKTRLIKGIALGLGLRSADEVVSPTYTLINEYSGRLPLYHIDAYRLKSARELAELGIEECFASKAVTVIEWADRVSSILPDKHLLITMSHVSPRRRRIVIKNCNLSQKFIKKLYPLIA